MKQYITDEKNVLNYKLTGDYYLPCISLPDESVDDIGRFGRAHYNYLCEHNSPILTAMMMKNTLVSYLKGNNEQAEKMFSELVKQLAEKEGVTEQLKAEDQMRWVGLMNNIRSRAEEIVMTEYVFL